MGEILTMHGTNLAEVDLNLLVSLQALLEERHVTRAARRVGVTQPAMSHALGRLRVVFDDALLVRSTAGLVLTQRAQALLPQLAEALSAVQSVFSPPQAQTLEALKRSFSLGLVDYSEAVLLPRLCQVLQEEAPWVQLNCRQRFTDAVGALATGELDLWLGVGPPVVPELFVQSLLTETYLCAVRRGHPLSKKRVTLKDFAQARHVQIAPGETAGGPLDTALAERGLRRHVSVRLPHFLVAPQLLRSTELVLTAPARLIRGAERSERLHVFEPPLPIKGFTLVQAWHARVHADPAHQWLRAAVASCLR